MERVLIGQVGAGRKSVPFPDDLQEEGPEGQKLQTRTAIPEQNPGWGLAPRQLPMPPANSRMPLPANCSAAQQKGLPTPFNGVERPRKNPRAGLGERIDRERREQR